ncbi:MAG: hypothetical protein LBU50_05365, partial [Cellulomonas sp.]|nr:hypothetical protein [Cellulomonas sp.]
MTQAAAAPAPQTAPAPPSQGQPVAGASGAPETGVQTPTPLGRFYARMRLPTPTRLRLVGVLAVVATLAAGISSWQASLRQAEALDAASASADRVLAIQQVRNDLVAADALATNGFLADSLWSGGSRVPYANFVDYANLLADAAQGLDELDIPDYGATALATYTGLVEQARSADRQSLPESVAYLDQASAELRGTLLPGLDALVESGADDTDERFDQVVAAPTPWRLALLGLGVLVAVQVWDARRTHRVVNPALIGALVLMLVVLTVAGPILSDTAARAQDGQHYPTTLALSQVVSHVYDAQALESLTLIKHGSGSAYEAAFVTATDEARRVYDQARNMPGVSGSGGPDFDAWMDEHRAIRGADDGGDWD